MKRSAIATLFAGAMALAAVASARAHDESKYPDITGQWSRPGSAQWDPTKPGGLRQQAPLTPEYQGMLEGAVKELANGGQTYNLQATCMPSGMPRMMIAYEPLEFIVTPAVTYIRSDHLTELRRIYTDGRDWPTAPKRSFTGYSIGKWVDADGDGRYDLLEVETRALKGPRNFDASGIPLHTDNQTVIKERIFLDRSDRDRLYDEVTTVDRALTRPWTVTRSYKREREPYWLEVPCPEANSFVLLNRENYWVGPDGLLMPTRKDQPPPDLRHFSAGR